MPPSPRTTNSAAGGWVEHGLDDGGAQAAASRGLASLKKPVPWACEPMPGRVAIWPPGLVTRRSGTPSWLKSPACTASGSLPPELSRGPAVAVH